MLLHLSQIGDSEAVESFSDVDVEQADTSADELLNSNDALLMVEAFSESFGVAVGVTGAEILNGIWHWRQSTDEVFGVVGTDFEACSVAWAMTVWRLLRCARGQSAEHSVDLPDN